MLVEAISCPKCGAPLRPPEMDEPWLCLYCSSLVRVQAEAGTSRASLESSLDAQAVQAVKQLLTSGKREEAIQRFQHLSGLDLEQAQRTIDRLGADIAIDTVFKQQLTPGGLALVIIGLSLLLASLVAWGLGKLNPWMALACAGLTGFLLFVYGRGFLTTLRYWNAPVASATTRYFAPIGAFTRGRLRAHVFKVVLDVHPAGGSPFQAEAIIPVRAENVARVRQGAMIQVKYLPGKPDSVIFHGQ
jgi:hypothetical protein